MTLEDQQDVFFDQKISPSQSPKVTSNFQSKKVKRNLIPETLQEKLIEKNPKLKISDPTGPENNNKMQLERKLDSLGKEEQ